MLEVLSERGYWDRGILRASIKSLAVWDSSEHRFTVVLEARHVAIEASNGAHIMYDTEVEVEKR